jgi:hypothetical protein
MENQGSVRLAREADPEGKRTIGQSILCPFKLNSQLDARSRYET